MQAIQITFARITFASTLLRLILYFAAIYGTSNQQFFTNRVELCTPLNSIKRVAEGFFLREHGISPWKEGDLVHQPPLLFALLDPMQSFLFGSEDKGPSLFCFGLFLVIEIVCVYLILSIYREIRILLTNDQLDPMDECNGSKKSDPYAPKFLSQNTLHALCLFNPYSILSVLSLNVTLIEILFVLLAVNFAIQGRVLNSMSSLAFSTYLGVYPIMYLIPLACILYPISKGKRFSGIAVCTALFSMNLAVLLVLSYLYDKSSWSFISSCYGFIMNVSDLTPNIGIFWYFVIEVFDQFRTFFLIIFQLHTFSFVIPTVIKFWKNPFMMLFVLIGVQTIFKSYPSYSDYNLFLAIVLMNRHLFQYANRGFFAIWTLVFSFVLTPLFWHLWIYYGTGNANFFYSTNLLNASALILILADMTKSRLRIDLGVSNKDLIPHDMELFMLS